MYIFVSVNLKPPDPLSMPTREGVLGWGHFRKPLPYLTAISIFFCYNFSYPINALTKTLIPYLSTDRNSPAVSDLATFKLIPQNCIAHPYCVRFVHQRAFTSACIYKISVSARAHHCGNPALQSEMVPRKTKKGPIWPFPFTRLQA